MIGLNLKNLLWDKVLILKTIIMENKKSFMWHVMKSVDGELIRCIILPDDVIVITESNDQSSYLNHTVPLSEVQAWADNLKLLDFVDKK